MLLPSDPAGIFLSPSLGLVCLLFLAHRYGPLVIQRFMSDMLPCDDAKAITDFLYRHIPTSASVTAPTSLVPPLAHRERIPPFPQPLPKVAFGPSGGALKQQMEMRMTPLPMGLAAQSAAFFPYDLHTMLPYYWSTLITVPAAWVGMALGETKGEAGFQSCPAQCTAFSKSALDSVYGVVGPCCGFIGMPLCVGTPFSGKGAIGFSPALRQTTTPAITRTMTIIRTANQVGTFCFIPLTSLRTDPNHAKPRRRCCPGDRGRSNDTTSHAHHKGSRCCLQGDGCNVPSFRHSKDRLPSQQNTTVRKCKHWRRRCGCILVGRVTNQQGFSRLLDLSDAPPL